MENIYGMIPLTLVTIIAVLYHIGHIEYEKGNRLKWKR